MKRVIGFFIIGNLVGESLPIQDLGVDGPTISIGEPNVLDVIEANLNHLDKMGELARHQSRIQEQFRYSLHNPIGKQLPRANEKRVVWVDPTVTIKADIRDAEGKLLFPSGTKVNPFDHVNLTKPLLFVDGTDSEQMDRAMQEKDRSPHLKIILIKGNPFLLMERHGISLYFDQSARLINKLGITHVPTLVTQDGKRLRLEELP